MSLDDTDALISAMREAGRDLSRRPADDTLWRIASAAAHGRRETIDPFQHELIEPRSLSGTLDRGHVRLNWGWLGAAAAVLAVLVVGLNMLIPSLTPAVVTTGGLGRQVDVEQLGPISSPVSRRTDAATSGRLDGSADTPGVAAVEPATRRPSGESVEAGSSTPGATPDDSSPPAVPAQGRTDNGTGKGADPQHDETTTTSFSTASTTLEPPVETTAAGDESTSTSGAAASTATTSSVPADIGSPYTTTADPHDDGSWPSGEDDNQPTAPRMQPQTHSYRIGDAGEVTVTFDDQAAVLESVWTQTGWTHEATGDTGSDVMVQFVDGEDHAMFALTVREDEIRIHVAGGAAGLRSPRGGHRYLVGDAGSVTLEWEDNEVAVSEIVDKEGWGHQTSDQSRDLQVVDFHDSTGRTAHLHAHIGGNSLQIVVQPPGD